MACPCLQLPNDPQAFGAEVQEASSSSGRHTSPIGSAVAKTTAGLGGNEAAAGAEAHCKVSSLNDFQRLFAVLMASTWFGGPAPVTHWQANRSDRHSNHVGILSIAAV